MEFLRISKCGSTSFTKNANLNLILPFNQSNENALRLASIRDPYHRFLSSIPETLKRISSAQTYSDDVVVDRKIIDHLSAKGLNSAESILLAFISAIDTHGFFDAHHEPQSHFFLDSNGDIAYNPHCFTLNNMNNILAGFQLDIKRYNMRNRNDTVVIEALNWRKRIKTKLGHLGIYNRDRHYIPFKPSRASIQYKFLSEYCKNFNKKHNHRIQLYAGLTRLRSELNSPTYKSYLEDFIGSKYKSDLNIFETLRHDNEGKSLYTFSEIYDKELLGDFNPKS